jgi:hypothetical protein
MAVLKLCTVCVSVAEGVGARVLDDVAEAERIIDADGVSVNVRSEVPVCVGVATSVRDFVASPVVVAVNELEGLVEERATVFTEGCFVALLVGPPVMDGVSESVAVRECDDERELDISPPESVSVALRVADTSDVTCDVMLWKSVWVLRFLVTCEAVMMLNVGVRVLVLVIVFVVVTTSVTEFDGENRCRVLVTVDVSDPDRLWL